MDKSTIEPTKKTVQELFQNSHTIVIPKYQRPFSWGADEAEELYKDIIKGSPDYFLGNILLNRKADSTLEVIDGQQRITSLSLLFLALYLHCKDIDIEDAEQVKFFLKKGTFGEKINTLKLSKINNELYERLLSLKKISEIDSLAFSNDSDRKILEVLKTFVDLIGEESNLDKNLETERIKTVFTKASDRSFFIVITTEDSKQASKLFEVLNNKGVDLTSADLVRNYLLSKADEQNFTDSIATWEHLEKKIGIDNLEQFLRYSSFLISDKDDIYNRIFEFSEKSSSKTAIDFFNSLSDFYLQIIEPGSYNENPNTVLEDFNIMGVSQIRSVLLAANSKFEISELSELSRILVNFIFRYSVICGRNPNKIESLSQDIAFNIYNGTYNFDTVVKKVKELDPTDDDFKKYFLLKSFKSTKIPRYIIGKIEDKNSSGEKKIDFAAVHLEHIMPKKIDKWRTADAYYNEDFHLQYVNQIGNMVLLSEKINTKIKNSLFAEKKNDYGGSNMNLIEAIKSKSSWKKEEIEQNALRYYSFAKDIWQI